MPDRMPEDMPDKMPEDMSDRMPEDLPVTKRIDVMVGITRSNNLRGGSKMVNCLKFGLVPDAQVYLRILLHHISKYIRIHVHTHIYYTLTTHMCAYGNIHTPDYQYMYVYNYKINTYIHT